MECIVAIAYAVRGAFSELPSGVDVQRRRRTALAWITNVHIDIDVGKAIERVETIVAVGCAPVVVALFGFLFLLFFDRDKLQSEDYQLRKRTIELAQQKGEPHPIEINPKAVIENPDLPSLTDDIREPKQ